MSAIRYGALPEEWDRFATLKVRLLPVVSNPDAPTSPQSKIPPENRGKVPTCYNAQRQVVGIAGWPDKHIIPEALKNYKADPDYGFCVVTGHGMVALDVDVTDAKLAEETRKTVAYFVGDAPVRERGNSPKFLVPLVVPGDVAKQIIETRAGRIELLGRGQQFVAAGTHPSGVRYTWSWAASGVPQLTREQLDELIAALAERFAVKPVAVPAAKVERQAGPAVETDQDAAVARAIEALHAFPTAIEGQGGDLTTYKAACLVRDLGVSQTRALEAMARWNSRCSPAWAPEDLAQKVANAFQYATSPAGNLTPEAMGFEVVPEAERASPFDPLPSSDAAQARKEVFGEAGDAYPDIPRAPGEPAKPPETPGAAPRLLLKAQGIRPADYVHADYLVKHWIDRRANALIFGQWNVGKSFVILDLCASLACGQPWFGNRVRQGRVLYLTYEGWNSLRKRWAALRTKYPKLDEAPFDAGQLTYPLTMREGERQLGARLTEFAETYGGTPDLLVIDPLQQALGGDDSDAGLMGRLNTLVNVVMQRQRCTVLRCHHSGHGDKSRSRGHSSLPAGVDAEIMVKATGERLGEIVSTKQRDSAKGKLGYRLDVVELGTDADGEQVSSCVVDQAPVGAAAMFGLNNTERRVLNVIYRLANEAGTVTRGSMLLACRTEGIVAEADNGRKHLHKILTRLATVERIALDGERIGLLERGAAANFDEEGTPGG